MKTRLLFIMLAICFMLVSCIETTQKTDGMFLSEKELREWAHKNECITANEFVNYEHDFVYEKELPCFLLIDRAILIDILPKGKIKDIEKTNWIGENDVEKFSGEFDYYAIFDCAWEGKGPNVFTAYLGINEETARKISEYIHPGGTPILYFYSPFIAVVDRVYHKNIVINKQYKVTGELLYIFKDDYTASDMLKKYQNEE